MPMSVVYATVNGQLVEEDRGGLITTYVSDTLGSVIQTRDEEGVETSRTSYWSTGEVKTQSETNPSPWGFCGTWGYYKDAAARFYVRARTYRADLSRWLTVDPLWPSEKPYSYANSRPLDKTDSTGLLPWLAIGIIALYGLLCVVCMFKVLNALVDINLGTQDKRKHCVMACMLYMLCGKVCSGLFVIGTEIFDLIAKMLGIPGHPSWDDLAANIAGFVCGSVAEVTKCAIWWLFSPRPWCENCCKAVNYGQ